MSKYTTFKKRWIDCTECELCDVRRKTVLARGKLPCDVLFIGEAPGQSEDVLGKPFVGPAGKLLDVTIEQAGGSEVRLAFTNLVCCIPKDELGGNKINEPHKEHIQACSERLLEFIRVAKPCAFVCVGKLAAKWLPKIVKDDEWYRDTASVEIVHPAAILRADISQRGLAIQQQIVQLSDLFEEVSCPF